MIISGLAPVLKISVNIALPAAEEILSSAKKLIKLANCAGVIFKSSTEKLF